MTWVFRAPEAELYANGEGQVVDQDGPGPLSKVTTILRLDTVGGVAPSTGCDAASVGAEARVDYTATYYFYRE